MLLMYNNSPNEQLLRNSSFEEEFTSSITGLKNWVVLAPYSSSTVERSTEGKVYGNFGLVFTNTNTFSTAKIMQILNITFFPNGTKLTFSALAKGVGNIRVSFVVADANEGILNHQIKVLKVNNNVDFNRVYGTFKLKEYGLATYTYILSIYFEGAVGYLDNVKLEVGLNPTKWSSSSDDSDSTKNIANVIPDTFLAKPPTPIPDVLAPGVELPPQVPIFPFGEGGGTHLVYDDIKDVKVEDGVIKGGSPRRVNPGTSGTSGTSSPIKEYDEFLEKEREFIDKDKDQSVNKAPSTWYDDEEHTKFNRKDMREQVKSLDLTTRKRYMTHWASNKLASGRRAHDLRMHSSLVSNSHEFINKYVEGKYQQKEHKILHRRGCF